ncbi:MAG TPA: HEAT repeat domain-containing protein [Thermodesulfobacteriota bacterium]|nr:HEAT repeat domain-containing protein [Thermodesulfobacteriota bacterium]
MDKKKIINFEPKERLFEKVNSYIESEDLFLEEKDRVYRNCLRDEDPYVRALALKRLGELSRQDLLKLKEEIKQMLSDPHMKVKQAALNILKKL